MKRTSKRDAERVADEAIGPPVASHVSRAYQPSIPMLAPPLSRRDEPTNDDRCTPPDVCAALVDFWPGGIDLDPCSNPWSLINARTRWDKRDDSLAKQWSSALPTIGGSIWLQPPYSMPLPFVRLAVHEWDVRGAEVLALVRHDSTTEAWDLIAQYAAGVCHFADRLHFRLAGEDTGAADFASSLLLLTPSSPEHGGAKGKAKRVQLFDRTFARFGHCYAPIGGAR